MDLKKLKEQIDSLKREVDKIAKSDVDMARIGELRNSFTGKKSTIAELFKELGTLPPEERKEAGAAINEAKQYVEEFFSRLEEQLLQHKSLKEDTIRDIDLTAPRDINQDKVPKLEGIGNLDPITGEIDRILQTFRTMGFSVFEARELDTEYYIFDSLGFPKNHPARENWDAFKTAEGFVPTPHTSNMQVRIMRLFKEPPVRAVIYGKCFRNEAVDVVHSHTFYQIEGVYVDKDINVSHMIATIKGYFESFFEQEVTLKIQPSYFPFVEPGIEFMVRCVFCGGIGCPCCKYSGWLEVAGAGMIHPVVLREAGIDPNEYTGFAWGLGLDRSIMQKNGINDIRSLIGSDIRFLKKQT